MKHREYEKNEPASVIKAGWVTGYPFESEWLEHGRLPPAPACRRITPEQRLLLRLFIEVAASYQENKSDRGRRWLLQDACHLCVYLPERTICRQKIIELVARIDAGEKIDFRLKD